MIARTCIGCGKQFETEERKGKTRRFCDKKCYEKYFLRERYRNNPEVRKRQIAKCMPTGWSTCSCGARKRKSAKLCRACFSAIRREIWEEYNTSEQIKEEVGDAQQKESTEC